MNHSLAERLVSLGAVDKNLSPGRLTNLVNVTMVPRKLDAAK